MFLKPLSPLSFGGAGLASGMKSCAFAPARVHQGASWGSLRDSGCDCTEVVAEGNWVLDSIEKVVKKDAGWFLFEKKWWNSKIFSEKISLEK